MARGGTTTAQSAGKGRFMRPAQPGNWKVTTPRAPGCAGEGSYWMRATGTTYAGTVQCVTAWANPKECKLHRPQDSGGLAPNVARPGAGIVRLLHGRSPSRVLTPAKASHHSTSLYRLLFGRLSTGAPAICFPFYIRGRV